MSKKSTDIDALIGADFLEITIGGKAYVVKDVPLQVFLGTSSEAEAGNDPMILHRQLSKLFGVSIEELSHIGYRSAALAVKEVQSWLFDAAGLVAPVEGASSEEPVNP